MPLFGRKKEKKEEKKETIEEGLCDLCKPTEQAAPGNIRIERLDEIYSTKERQVVFLPTSRPQPPAGKLDTVLKVRRHINSEGKHYSTDVDILSDFLKAALVEIYKNSSGTGLATSPPAMKPELMFHAREGLQKAIDEEQIKPQPDKIGADALCVALQYIEEDYGPTIESLKSLTLHDEITFKLLWTLFPPNTHVYSKKNMLQEEQLFKVRSVFYQKRQDGSEYFRLRLRAISHDGERLGWVDDKIDIDDFEGSKKVQECLCFPLSRHAEEDSVRARLLQRGKRFLELTKATYQEYNGPTVAEDRNVVIQGEYKQVMFHVSGRIMLDPETFFQQNDNNDMLKEKVQVETKINSLTDNDIIFCDHRVPGFSFHQKRWCVFAINRMSPIIWNEDAFSKLVMEPKRRDLIHMLVKSHRNAKDSFDDVVSGKGRGLVGLLSGKPGVGKTLTAEVIAEVTKRPLYMLSAGELGTLVESVEKRLDMVLEITRRWGCVLLIDEADVFLQERDVFSLDRNALISIFLRRLEYFQGVLLMTTNRKSTIDAAFNSRIHFKLHYEDLTVASRMKIWRNNLVGASAASVEVEIREQDLQELARLNINGRQIKNSIACAVSVAAQEKKALTMDGVKTMLEMVVEVGDEPGEDEFLDAEG